MFTDECIVGRNTTLKVAYAAKHTNVTLDKDLFEAKPVYVVAAISAEYGVESLRVYHKSINSDSFKLILPDIHSHGEYYCILGDNVKYHTSKALKKEYEQFDTEFVGSV